MAYSDFPPSSWFGKTLEDALTTSADLLNDGNTYKAHLWTDAFVNPYGGETWDANASLGDYTAETGMWDTANGESAGAALTLAGVTFAASGGSINLVTSTTLTWNLTDEDVVGIMIHNETDDVGICVINFGEAKTVSGDLTVAVDTTYDLTALIF